MSWQEKTRGRLASALISNHSPKPRIIQAVFIQGVARGAWRSTSADDVRKYLDKKFTKPELWEALDAANRGESHEVFAGWKQPAVRASKRSSRAAARGTQLLLMFF